MFSLSVLATATDGNGYEYTVPATESVTVNAAPPVLSGHTSATVNEGGLVTLAATDSAAFADDALGNVTITGLPHNLNAASFNGGTYTASTGTWVGTAAQFNALTFDAGGHGTFTLSISATTQGASAPATENYTLTVNPASPVLGGDTSATVNEGGLVTLAATDSAAFADDTLGNVTITGLPHNLNAASFNGGSYTASAGTWVGTAAQFNALTFDAGGRGTFALSISATTAGAWRRRQETTH